MVACGRGFTVAVKEDGELLAWGDGRQGHLGLGAVLHQQEPARAGGPGCLPTSASAWPRPAAATCWWWWRTGRSSGSDFYGRLGLGDEQP